MDIQTKINRLKQLKQRQAIINNRITENNKKNTSIYTAKTPLLSKHDIHNPFLPETNKKPRSRKTISEQFIESNKETYESLIEEAKKQSYIKTILNTINVNNTSQTNNVIDNIDLNNKEALINLFKNIKNNTHNTLETTDEINNTSRLSDVSDVPNVPDVSDVSDISDLSDSSDDEYTDYDNTPSISSVPSTHSTNNTANTARPPSATNTKKVIISNTVNSKPHNTVDLLNKQKMLDDIEFLRTASSETKAMCDNYLQNELNKITKIIKVYIIKSRNNFINISTALLDYVFYGYKHVPYYDTHKLTTGDLVKIIFTYDGYVYIKDFAIYKWNTKNNKLQCRYCTITYTDNDKIIKTSKNKIVIQPSWIIITKINPQELINYCN